MCARSALAAARSPPVNSAGMLKVGPESAGSNPGPICFGRGGTRPTITDANLVLGRLPPDKLTAVTLACRSGRNPRRPSRATSRRHSDLTIEAAAEAVLTLANMHMAGAIRAVSLSRGHDPRDFVLFAFGGAGPLHAVELARELGIPEVLVPARPGMTNALGCLVADLRQDYVQTLNTPLEALDDARLSRDSRRACRARAAANAADGDDRRNRSHPRRRHAVPRPDPSHSRQPPECQRHETTTCRPLFETAYFARFHVELPEIKAQLVNLTTSVIGKRPAFPIAELLDATLRATSALDARTGTRKVYAAANGSTAAIYAREALPLGAEIDGPAIIEQVDATTVIPPGARARVDAVGNLRISVRTQMTAIDPLTLAVIEAGLRQVCNEMDIAFSRSAFSPVIAEADDRADGIYDRDTGRLIRQGEFGLPVFVGTMQHSTADLVRLIKEGRAGKPNPGDIYIVNDPYLGGTHLMDVRFVLPFYYQGEHVCWLQNTGHWPDVGGAVPGGFSAKATEVEQEGLRLPPVKLFKRGDARREIFAIIQSNIRVADQRIGDIKAQAAALKVGERRLTDLIDRFTPSRRPPSHRRT